MGAQTREKMIETLAKRLSMPRVQISIILLLTGFSAFAASATMLRTGMTDMVARYSLSVVVGYFVFLILLRIWIWLQSDEKSDPNIDLSGDLIIPNIHIGGGISAKDGVFGGGGDFSGAGAGSSWPDGDVPFPPPAVGLISGSSSATSSGPGSGLGGIDFDIDDGAALILVVVILALVFSALIYVVWIAPILLAELVIDAAVVGALYKPVKNIERRYWLSTAIIKTGIPALFILIMFAAAGLIIQAADPDAVTIGQFLRSVSRD